MPLTTSRSGYEPIGLGEEETGRYSSFALTLDPPSPPSPEPETHNVRPSQFHAAPTSHSINADRSELSRSRYGHVKDLDQFFTRLYDFHQRGGFTCMLIAEILDLLQFLFLVCFSVFVLQCVDYDILFKNKAPEGKEITDKRTIADAIIPHCVSHINVFMWLCMLVSLIFFFFRLLRGAYQLLQYWEIANFYSTALKIPAHQLDSLTWHQILQKLIMVQSEIQLCIQKSDLTELDVYQRILRHKNYLCAMVNKDLIPSKKHIPYIGGLNTGLKFNLEFLLFWGPWSPWKDYYSLRPEFKSRERLTELTHEMERVVTWLALANLVLFPVRILWLILYFFFSTAELVKRQPGALGARKWSIYARYYLRHFNELDHELNNRLNRAHKPSTQYMDLFYSRSLELFAKNISIAAGAFLVTLLILTSWDEDVIQVEHVVTVMSVAGLIIFVSKSFIPDEHLVWCPEWLMNVILSQIHYMPDEWKGCAHTERVRREFGYLFEFRVLFVLEELLSALTTPAILYFWVRPRCYRIVEFYHKFTVTVPGLGDVCSFAQMDVKRHGAPDWNGSVRLTHKEYKHNEHEAKGGKTEMSLVHFTFTNPEWKPPEPSREFLEQIKEQTRHDTAGLREHEAAVADNPLIQSLTSLVPLQYPLHSSNHHQAGRGVSQSEGPLVGSGMGESLLSSVQHEGLLAPPTLSLIGSSHLHQSMLPPLEGAAAEMSLHALYLHKLRDKGQRGYGSVRLETNPREMSTYNNQLWQLPEDNAPLLFDSSE